MLTILEKKISIPSHLSSLKTDENTPCFTSDGHGLKHVTHHFLSGLAFLVCYSLLKWNWTPWWDPKSCLRPLGTRLEQLMSLVRNLKDVSTSSEISHFTAQKESEILSWNTWNKTFLEIEVQKKKFNKKFNSWSWKFCINSKCSKNNFNMRLSYMSLPLLFTYHITSSFSLD